MNIFANLPTSTLVAFFVWICVAWGLTLSRLLVNWQSYVPSTRISENKIFCSIFNNDWRIYFNLFIFFLGLTIVCILRVYFTSSDFPIIDTTLAMSKLHFKICLKEYFLLILFFPVCLELGIALSQTKTLVKKLILLSCVNFFSTLCLSFLEILTVKTLIAFVALISGLALLLLMFVISGQVVYKILNILLEENKNIEVKN